MNAIYRMSQRSYNGKQFILKLNNGYGMYNIIVKLIPFHKCGLETGISKAIHPCNILVIKAWISTITIAIIVGVYLEFHYPNIEVCAVSSGQKCGTSVSTISYHEDFPSLIRCKVSAYLYLSMH